MQSNSIVKVQTSTLNDFSEAVAEVPESMKCTVARYGRTITTGDRAGRKQHDLVIIVNHKEYSPYKDIFESDHARVKILYDGRTFELKSVSRIDYSHGKPRCYTIGLDQVQY